MTEDHWTGDIFERRVYAEKWTKFLVKKSDTHSGGLTVALDAPWGAGKSFFVQRWAESLKANHPVVIFDAWKNDHVDDPMVAFIAELTQAIKKLKKDADLTAPAAQKIEAESVKMVKSMGNALLPTAKVIGKAMARKVIGLETDELMEAWGSGRTPAAIEITGAESSAAISKGIEQFMQKTLDGYQQRRQGVEAFQQSLGQLVQLVEENAHLHKPLFVFIDEVDRCRPDFAIRLLEEVKHIFGVKGIVFVLCVNVDQLSKSVRALYGSDFDGQGYLHRFFDLEFRLPRPTNLAYAKLLLTDSALAHMRIYQDIYVNGNDERFLAHCFSDIADLFGLSLREQEHVLNSAALAATDLKDSLHLHWLFYLAGLKYKLPTWFARLSEGAAEAADVGKMVSQFSQLNATVTIYAKPQENSSQWLEKEMRISDLLTTYYNVWSMTRIQASELVKGERTFVSDIANSFLSYSGSTSRDRRIPGPHTYIDAIATCGLRS
jgi:KAP family P-loop domain